MNRTAKIVDVELVNLSDWLSHQSTALAQREKMEAIIINLATCLGYDVVYKHQSENGSTYYSPGNYQYYQSATNTILWLSDLMLTVAVSQNR